jgi:hypothetical protein
MKVRVLLEIGLLRWTVHQQPKFKSRSRAWSKAIYPMFSGFAALVSFESIGGQGFENAARHLKDERHGIDPKLQNHGGRARAK